jgi:hypothetical protein
MFVDLDCAVLNETADEVKELNFGDYTQLVKELQRKAI